METNDAFCASTGYAGNETLGRSAADLGLWSDREWADLIEPLVRGESIRNVECRVRRKDREPLDCLLSAEIVSINGQDCVLIAWLDITARKRSEMELVTAIEGAMKDTTWFSRSLLEKLSNVKNQNCPNRVAAFDDLTARERDVFDGLCRGQPDKEIARRLDVAASTVRNHVAAIYEKLDVHSRGAVILWARNHGYLATKPDDVDSGPRRFT